MAVAGRGDVAVAAKDKATAKAAYQKALSATRGSIDKAAIKTTIYQHPEFGAHLIRIVAQRAAWPAPIKLSGDEGMPVNAQPEKAT